MRFLPLILACLWSEAVARAGDVVTTPRVEARLVAAVEGVPANGGTIALALHQRMQPDWHTYWRNPGESGEPVTLAWTLPEGFTAGEINWPTPERIAFGDLANYGFSEEVLLRVDISVPPGLTPGQRVTFTADASWLVCKDICIPEKATLDLTLPVVAGEPATNEAWREAFATARAEEPKKDPSFGTASQFWATNEEVILHFVPWQAVTTTGTREFWFPPEVGDGAQFFPFTKGLIKASAVQSPVRNKDGFTISVPPGWKLRDSEKRKEIDTIDGVLVLAPSRATEGVTQAFEVTLTRASAPPASVIAPAAADLPLMQAILFAILGGLILNLMPCVFPILSMKALALVQAGHAERPWTDGLAYLLGVLTTFAALGGALLWLRAMGEDAGWGFQLQSPLSVAILAYILTLVGLNLSGVFQIGGSIQGAGQEFASRGGLVGTFFTGVLAVIVAAPCTAPFMGAAMGYAFTQAPPITMAIFLALGFGLALPWVLVTLSPALVRLLPRPGAWMERFKQFLAFPMYGAAAWLVWVVSQQVTPEGLARVMFGIVLLALAAWAFGVVQARAAMSQRIVLSSLVFLLSLAAAVALIAMPFTTRTSEPQATAGTASLPSEPYTAARLAELREAGKPVFVNLTAAWCVSCLYNERVALSSNLVAEAFKASGTIYLIGDWTNQNPEISALLKQHGREGVPLYLYYPPGGAEPKILPQILNETLMLEVLGISR
jgi:thiol:disulfide interchange protein DsbD